MQCEEVREQYAGYVIDQIEEPARLLVTEHLAACELCRAEVDEIKTLWTGLGSVPALEPSPELRSRFHLMVEAYRHGMDRAPKATWLDGVNSWLSGWWPRQPVMQFSLAVVLLVIGGLIGRQFQSARVPAPQTSSEVAGLRNELSQMRQLVAVSLMQQQSASDRLKGVNWSYQVQKPDSEVLTTLLDTLMHDPNVNVRLATVDALRQFGDQPVVRRGVVEAMTRQESAMVQIALIDLAVDLREKESIGALQQLTSNAEINETVRERAQKGLMELE